MSGEAGFIDPTAAGTVAPVPPARRPARLDGLVVGLLDNTKEQADLVLDAVGAVLRERHGAAAVVRRRKEHYARPAAPALITELAGQVHVAVAALGG
jgi:hypothetical protein